MAGLKDASVEDVGGQPRRMSYNVQRPRQSMGMKILALRKSASECGVASRQIGCREMMFDECGLQIRVVCSWTLHTPVHCDS